MPLITKISEIRAVINMSVLSDDAALPNIEKAERKHIIPVIGKPLYQDMVVKYNAVPQGFNTYEGLLLKHIQLALAAYALHDDLALMHTHITDMGLRRASSNNLPAAFKWEYNATKSALLDVAQEGLEILLNFLFAEKEEFPLWENDEAYQQYLKLIIRSGTEFSGIYRLYQPLRTYAAIMPLMDDVKDNYLIPTLGEALLNYFVESENPTDYEKEVLRLLKKGAAHLTIKHACEQFPVQFSERGFTVINSGDQNSDDAGITHTPSTMLELKMRAADRDGNNFLIRGRNYIVKMLRDQTLQEDFSEDFQSAVADSPLKDYATRSDTPDRGNDRRKIFRM